jgi:hypothetical protein
MAWRFASASVTGSSHARTDLPCQDTSRCAVLTSDGASVLVATVSDGAGSAARSEVGSHLTCESFHAEIAALVAERGAGRPLEREHIDNWIRDLAGQIGRTAETMALTPRDLACTFVGAVLAPTWSVFCQVGDGAVVVNALDPKAIDSQAAHEWNVVFWPEQGEYANETYFVTESRAVEHLQFERSDAAVREIALFSDGIQRLVLRYESQRPFDPFFRRMFAPLRHDQDGDGERATLSRELAAYLGSPLVSERTDDDVSLILATCLTADEVRSHEAIGDREAASEREAAAQREANIAEERAAVLADPPFGESNVTAESGADPAPMPVLTPTVDATAVTVASPERTALE